MLTPIMLIILFLVLHFNFLFDPCGRLSWLPVSFLLHVKHTLSYRIVSYVGNLSKFESCTVFRFCRHRHATAFLSVCPSVCHTQVRVNTNNCRITRFSPSGGPGTLFVDPHFQYLRTEGNPLPGLQT